jgi:hypothetical protein
VRIGANENSHVACAKLTGSGFPRNNQEVGGLRFCEVAKTAEVAALVRVCVRGLGLGLGLGAARQKLHLVAVCCAPGVVQRLLQGLVH